MGRAVSPHIGLLVFAGRAGLLVGLLTHQPGLLKSFLLAKRRSKMIEQIYSFD